MGFGFVVMFRFQIRVVCSRVSVAYDGYPATHPAFEKSEHFGIGNQFQLHFGMFQVGIPCQRRGGNVMGWVETVCFQREVAEVFEHVG